MHDKIKLLAEQALKSSMIHDEVYRPEGYANGISKNFADKFAELIVAECFNKLTPYMDDQFINDIESELKEHFGVEQ